ncbi:TonB-dependent receptor [bacterium]|nr:TonB-dependent receptor [bacterium]
MRVWLALLICLSVALAESSSNGRAKAFLTLPEITVWSSVTPSRESFTAEDIRKMNPATVADFLVTVPGVSIRRDGVSGGYSTVRIGGSNANQVLVLVDGIIWNDVGSGEANLSTIPAEWIESLNIYRGSSTALSGEAIGGILEIHTIREQSSNARVSAHASETESEMSISRGATQGEVNWNASYSRIQSEGDYKFRITEEDGNGPFTEHLGEAFSRENNSLTRDRLTLSVSSPVGKGGSLRLKGWLDEAAYGMPGYLAPRPTLQASADESRRTASLNFAQGFSRARFDFNANHAERSYHFFDHDPLSWIHASHESTQRSAATLSISEAFARNALIQTAGVQRETIGSSTIRGGDAERWKWNAGLLASRLLLETESDGFDLKASAGLRGEGFGEFDPVALPEVALSLAREGKIRHHFTVSASRAYRAPSFYDLFWDDELLSLGNPQLKPETSSLLRAETSVGAGEAYATSLRVSAQDNQVKDLIYWHPAFDGHWTPDNLRKATLRSLQIELTREWISDHVQSSVSYEWLEARDRSGDRLTDGEYLIYRAPRAAHASLFAQIEKFRLHAEYTWSDRQYVLDTNSKWLSDYQLFDIGVSRGFSFRKFSMDCSADVTNVMNEDYRIVRHAPMPLREYRLSVSLSSL